MEEVRWQQGEVEVRISRIYVIVLPLPIQPSSPEVRRTLSIRLRQRTVRQRHSRTRTHARPPTTHIHPTIPALHAPPRQGHPAPLFVQQRSPVRFLTLHAGAGGI